MALGGWEISGSVFACVLLLCSGPCKLAETQQRICFPPAGMAGVVSVRVGLSPGALGRQNELCRHGGPRHLNHNTLHCLSLTWLSVPSTMRDASLLSLVDSEVLTNSIYLYLQANGTSPVFRKRSKSYVASLRLKSWGHEMKAFLNVQ